jgi:hypothetical protein
VRFELGGPQLDGIDEVVPVRLPEGVLDFPDLDFFCLVIFSFFFVF